MLTPTFFPSPPQAPKPQAPKPPSPQGPKPTCAAGRPGPPGRGAPQRRQKLASAAKALPHLAQASGPAEEDSQLGITLW